MSTHTPGPWRYCPTNNGHMVAGSKPGYLAEVRDCGSGDVRKNASVIAAAPDLLAACQLVADSALRGSAYDACVAAIAKATGS